MSLRETGCRAQPPNTSAFRGAHQIISRCLPDRVDPRSRPGVCVPRRMCMPACTGSTSGSRPAFAGVLSRPFDGPGGAPDASSLHPSARWYSVRTNVYVEPRATLVEGSGGVGKEMQAAAQGTDVLRTQTARVWADHHAGPADDPRRLLTPRRSPGGLTSTIGRPQLAAAVSAHRERRALVDRRAPADPRRPGLQPAGGAALRGRGWGMLGTVRSSRHPAALPAGENATEPRARVCLPAPFRVFAHIRSDARTRLLADTPLFPDMYLLANDRSHARSGQLADTRLFPPTCLSARTGSGARLCPSGCTRDLADTLAFTPVYLTAYTRPFGRVHPSPRVHPRPAMRTRHVTQRSRSSARAACIPSGLSAPEPCILGGLFSAREACIPSFSQHAQRACPKPTKETR